MKLKKSLAVLLASCTLTMIFGVVPVYASEEKKNYIVFLESPEVLSKECVSLFCDNENVSTQARQEIFQNQNEIKSEISSFLSVPIFSDEDNEKIQLSFTDVLNGFTVYTTEKKAEQIRNISGVESVVEDKIIYMSEPQDSGTVYDESVTESINSGDSESSTTYSKINSGNLIGADKMYAKGYDGTGRAIAVIDSELDYNNDFLKLSDEKSAKFTKSSIEKIIAEKGVNVGSSSTLGANTAYRNSKIPFAYNYIDMNTEINGSLIHGSHVSGIAVGNAASVDDGTENSGLVSGIAPEAQLLFFRVANNEGKISTASIIAAVDDAVKFGVDSINISIGADCLSENAQDTIAKKYRTAVLNAESAGVSIIFAAGNSARYKNNVTKVDYSTGDNFSYPYASKVGSVHSTYTYSEYLTDGTNKYYCDTRGSTAAAGPWSIAVCASGSKEDISAANVNGKAAVIPLFHPLDNKPGFAEAYSNAANAGAAAVIIINTYNQVTNGNLGYSLPAFYMPKDEAARLIENNENSPVLLSYEAKSEIFKRTDAPLRSYYTSYCYSDNLDIAADFSAPGGNIYSSVPYNKMANMSGTSMAAPQVTGAMALMYEFIENTYNVTGAEKVMLARNLLASTADTVYEENGSLSSPRAVGSGIINLDKATETNVILKANDSQYSKVNIGANLGDTFSVSFTAKNIGEKNVTFDSSLVELSSDDYDKFYNDTVYGFCGIKKLNCTSTGFSPITIAPGEEEQIEITISLDREDIEYLNQVMSNGFFVDGKITLSSSNDSNCDVGIPFSGFYGDWNRASIIDKSSIQSQMCFYSQKNGYYTYSPPQNTNNGVVLYMSENPDEQYLDSVLMMGTGAERSAYITMSAGSKTIFNNIFMNKDYSLYSNLITVRDMAELAKNGGTLHFQMILPYYKNLGESKTQTLDINIVPDNENPNINVQKYTQSGKTMAKITASDNHRVSTIYYTATNEYGVRQIYSKEFNKQTCEWTVNITNLKGVDFTAVDSAFNSAGIYCGIDIIKENETLKISNTSAYNYKGTLVIGVYDDSGRLVQIKSPNLTSSLPAFDDLDISSYVSDLSNTHYKVFFWDGTNLLEPLCASYDNTK